MKPYFAVYASFFQRSFDQMIHDVCMPKLNVTLLLDRAGLVGEDGATHPRRVGFGVNAARAEHGDSGAARPE